MYTLHHSFSAALRVNTIVASHNLRGSQLSAVHFSPRHGVHVMKQLFIQYTVQCTVVAAAVVVATMFSGIKNCQSCLYCTAKTYCSNPAIHADLCNSLGMNFVHPDVGNPVRFVTVPLGRRAGWSRLTRAARERDTLQQKGQL